MSAGAVTKGMSQERIVLALAVLLFVVAGAPSCPASSPSTI